MELQDQSNQSQKHLTANPILTDELLEVTAVKVRFAAAQFRLVPSYLYPRIRAFNKC